MIVSFRDEWLRAFFVEERQSRHIPPDLESRLFRKLQMIDDAQGRKVAPKVASVLAALARTGFVTTVDGVTVRLW